TDPDGVRVEPAAGEERALESSQQQVTRALARLGDGHKSGVAELMPLVYDELRRVAGDLLRRQSPGPTLQATALVHEAYLRLVGQTQLQWQSRAHFFAVGATVMRQILVNHFHARRAAKRGGGRTRVTLCEAIDASARERGVSHGPGVGSRS